MRLKTQLTAVVSIAIALVLGMGVATLMVASRSAEVSKAQGKVHQAQKRVADLLALTHEFTTYSEVRAEQQWRSNYAAFLELLAGSTSEFAVYSSKAQKEAQPIAAIFQQIVDARASRSTLRDRQVELLVGQLTIGMQAASDAVDQWSEAIDETDRRTQFEFGALALSVPVLIMVILVLVSALLIKRILIPLGRLQRAVRAVASGDFSVRSATGTADEFGELSQAFDEMALDLVRTLRAEVAERKQIEDQVRQLAFSDPLTGLPNRRMLMDRLEQALIAACRHGRQDALLFIDLDNFKTLNDTLGHDKGDLLLRQIATRLVACVRQGDTVARLGGDEFVVLLQDLSGNALQAGAQVQVVASKLLSTLGQPYELDGHGHHSTASIGVTLFGGTERESIEEPLKRAELAMYQAKAIGRNTLRFFEPEMQTTVTARAKLEAQLRQAVARKQFLLHYQPQAGSDTGTTGAEALVRWQHPERGLVLPGEFIAVAESSGLILPLGHWVLESACKQLAAWATRPGLAHLSMAVNVSARQMRQPDFVQEVISILESTGANPALLKLELTESVLVDNVEDIIVKMNALKAQGVGFSLDDFGTGYSSLAYLKRLPLDQLKIDEGFVRDVLVDPEDAAIAKMVVALADSLGLAVIAEGVETQAQRDFLTALGCSNYQGYLLGAPMALTQFEAFIDGHRVAEPAAS